jgi:hypothetical protein
MVYTDIQQTDIQQTDTNTDSPFENLYRYRYLFWNPYQTNIDTHNRYLYVPILSLLELDLFTILCDIDITKSYKWNRTVPVVIRCYLVAMLVMEMMFSSSLIRLSCLAVVYRDTDNSVTMATFLYYRTSLHYILIRYIGYYTNTNT